MQLQVRECEDPSEHTQQGQKQQEQTYFAGPPVRELRSYLPSRIQMMSEKERGQYPEAEKAPRACQSCFSGPAAVAVGCRALPIGLCAAVSDG